MNVETFPKAPIREALIDIHVTLPPETTLEVLATFHDLVKDRFPTRRERSIWMHQFRMAPSGEAQAEVGAPQIDGFLSEGEGKIVQARRDGFTFNKLRPYGDWTSFSGEARELWSLYCDVAKPVNVTRLGTRYINRIEVPLPLGDFRDYCPLFPELPAELPQSLAEFFMRFTAPLPDIGDAMSVVTTTFEPPSAGGATLPLILDIDVFQTFNVLAPAQELLWPMLDQLRDAKNKIFFASVTEAAKRLFR